MSEKDINRWHDANRSNHKGEWKIGSGGSWDMLDVQPISDAMLAELAQRYQYAGCPWNCHYMPLSGSDREYMYLLYFSMQGLVARMRKAESNPCYAELTRLREELKSALALSSQDHASMLAALGESMRLREDVAHWKHLYECAQNANSYRQDVIDGSRP